MPIRKLIAILITIIYLIVMFLIFNSITVLVMVSLGLIFPLLLIFFNEEMSYYQGFLGRIGPKITKESPASVVEFMGWLLLIFLIIIIFIQL